MCGFLDSVSHNFIQCFAFVFNKLNLYSVFCMYSINQNYIQWFAQAFISVTSIETYIQWTHEICFAIKNRFFLFLLCHSGVFLFSTRLYIQEGYLFLC